jgi:hypothetical protein
LVLLPLVLPKLLRPLLLAWLRAPATGILLLRSMLLFTRSRKLGLLE